MDQKPAETIFGVLKDKINDRYFHGSHDINTEGQYEITHECYWNTRPMQGRGVLKRTNRLTPVTGDDKADHGTNRDFDGDVRIAAQTVGDVQNHAGKYNTLSDTRA